MSSESILGGLLTLGLNGFVLCHKQVTREGLPSLPSVRTARGSSRVGPRAGSASRRQAGVVPGRGHRNEALSSGGAGEAEQSQKASETGPSVPETQMTETVEMAPKASRADSRGRRDAGVGTHEGLAP